MIGGEQVVEARRANEILVEADKLRGIGIRKSEIKINDFICTNTDFRGDKAHDSLIVLAEDLALISKVLI